MNPKIYKTKRILKNYIFSSLITYCLALWLVFLLGLDIRYFIFCLGATLLPMVILAIKLTYYIIIDYLKRNKMIDNLGSNYDMAKRGVKELDDVRCWMSNKAYNDYLDGITNHVGQVLFDALLISNSKYFSESQRNYAKSILDDSTRMVTYLGHIQRL